MLILASASPRRAELLRQIGLNFQVMPADIDESQHPDEMPEDFAHRLSYEKADSIYQRLVSKAVDREKPTAQHSSVVLGADTIVLQDDQVFGKPDNFHEFKSTMNQLSGNRHQVMSAVSLLGVEIEETLISVTDVYFRELSTSEIEEYWHTGEPRDKAGGYAIQGLAASFIRRIEGSYSGVMGLPLYEVSQMLTRHRLFSVSSKN